MGLSSKQVSSDEVDWSQTFLLQAQTLELPKPVPRQHQQMMNNQQQQPERLNCPRCNSTNTKFCYYNNYNKSQPRHLCKACKRHWTKGGTLRNIPIGGGRKNKRIKTSNNKINTESQTTTTSTSNNNWLRTHMGIDQQRQSNVPDFGFNDQKSLSGMIYRSVMINPESSLLQQSSSISNCSNMMNPPVVPDQNHQALRFPFSSSSSSSNFETNPASISPSFQSSSVYNFNGAETTKDPMMMPITSSTTVTQPWQVAAANTSSGIDHIAANYWNWDDIDTLISTHDLNIPWDDSDIKP